MLWTDASLLGLTIKALYFNEIKDACDTLDNTKCWNHNSAYNTTRYISHLGAHYVTHLSSHCSAYNATRYITHQGAHYVTYLGTHYGTYRSTHYATYYSGYHYGVDNPYYNGYYSIY